LTKKIEKPKREVTKRQLSHWQQQKKRQRITLGIGIFIIIAVLGIVGIGWYIKLYQPLHQTVIRVNDTTFDMNYYIKMLKYYGEGQPSYNIYRLADEVVWIIEQDELARQGAMELGITVSEEEVEKELKSYDPPLSKDYRDVARVRTLKKKLLDEYFEQMVPMFAEQRHILAILLESETQATEVRARLESDEDFGELAGELSLESFSKTKSGDLGWQPKEILADLLTTSIPGDYAFDSDVGVLSQPIYDEMKIKSVGYWLVEVLERKQEPEQAHVRAILLGNEEQAQQVKNRLEAGEDFATLSKEFSQYGVAQENDGDLGWLSPGMGSPVFEELVFDTELELKTLRGPIRDETALTKGGYWLVKALDIDDNKEISDEDRDLLKIKALNEWGSSLWDDPKNEIDDSYLDAEKKEWAIKKAMES